MSIMHRRIDELGRVVLPTDMRDALDLLKGEKVVLELQQDCITLRKSVPCCASCRGTRNLHRMATGKFICDICLESAV